jgi:uncharacterized protein (DUF885 family)
MDRRQFLTTTAATTAGLAVAAPSIAQPAGGNPAAPGDAKLNALLEEIFMDRVKRSPTFATGLGLDKGPLAPLKAQFDTRPLPQARKEDLALAKRDLARVKAINPATLSSAGKLNRDVVVYQAETGMIAQDRFGIDSAVRPYPIFQQGGVYFSIPDFLNSSHTVETVADVEAYLSRLAQVDTLLDNESADQKVQAARGFLAPQWSIDLTLAQMKKLRGVPAADSGLVQSLAKRAAAKSLAGDWAARAAAIVDNEIYPALDRQIAMMESLRPTSKAGDGAQRLPNGDAIYAAALKQMTTTNFTPDEVHRLGLAQVAEISAALDVILKSAGLTQGSVGARLDQLNRRADQVYPNTAEGRLALIASLNEGVKDMATRLPAAFATLPTQPLEIRAVPVEIQDGASNGYYRSATLDGSRPAIYYINLKDVGDWPKYSLPALTYHEGSPGHHLQISLAQKSTDIPTLRKLGGFSAYSEGWALYAEEVAEELGAYKGIEKAGYLQSFLFRAARLVVDTGLHAKGWSREKAVDYMVGATGFARPRVQREVERYCTQMGQACSYKVGHMAWTRARKEAEKTLGPKFDLKQFHEVLKDGAMPLTLLEARIRERTQRALRG